MSLASANCHKIKLYQFVDVFSNEKLFQKINILNPNEVKNLEKVKIFNVFRKNLNVLKFLDSFIGQKSQII